MLGGAAVAGWPRSRAGRSSRGRALDSRLTWERDPGGLGATRRTTSTDGGRRPARGRAPRPALRDYDWGGTVDPILPALADRPVAVRYAVPYADLRAVDLLWTVDGLVSSERALPGQLGPLLDLLGAATVVAGADDDRAAAAPRPRPTPDVLDQLGAPDERWGPVRLERRAAGRSAPRRAAARARLGPAGRAAGRARRADAGATVVDGGAEALAALAAFGALPRGRVAYAGDARRGETGARGGEVVITDSNRRRVLAAARMAQNHGATLAGRRAVLARRRGARPVPRARHRRPDGRGYDGARHRAPFSPAYSQFPERRPFAAFDGDPATHWQADRALDEAATGSRSASTRRATSTRSSCCRTRTGGRR